MKQSTKDKMQGAGHEAKGAVKEAVGHAIHKPGMEAAGHIEKVAGKAQRKHGEVEKAAGK